MKTKFNPSSVIRTLKGVKLENITFQSFLEYFRSIEFDSAKYKLLISSFLSVKRNRLFISSGIAGILILLILPGKIELVLGRKSILEQYQRESTLLDDLQNELNKVSAQLSAQSELISRINDLIPPIAEVEKISPIIFTNLINLSDLRLVEIISISESAFLGDQDDQQFAEFNDEFDEEFDEEFEEDDFGDDLSQDDESISDDDFSIDGDFSSDQEFFPDDDIDGIDDSNLSEGLDILSTSQSSPQDVPSISSLYYSITVTGLSDDLFDFFRRLHSTKILSSIGKISYVSSSNSSNNNQSDSGNSSMQQLTVSFTLKVAVSTSSTDSESSVSNSLFEESASSDFPPNLPP